MEVVYETVYVARDGARFYRERQCLDHEALLTGIEEVMAPLRPRPDRMRGGSYIRQPDLDAVRRARLFVLRSAGDASPAFARAIETLESGGFVGVGSIVGRIFDDTGGLLSRAWSRLCLIDEHGRDWEQPYYAYHPEEGTGEMLT